MNQEHFDQSGENRQVAGRQERENNLAEYAYHEEFVYCDPNIPSTERSTMRE
jgi:hypothetical protein